MTDIDALLKERCKRYGRFDDHAAISQDLKEVMMGTNAWLGALKKDQREALEMIQHKVARILNGDPNYIDNWDDIAGYAKLVADRLSLAKANRLERIFNDEVNRDAIVQEQTGEA